MEEIKRNGLPNAVFLANSALPSSTTTSHPSVAVLTSAKVAVLQEGVLPSVVTDVKTVSVPKTRFFTASSPSKEGTLSREKRAKMEEHLEPLLNAPSSEVLPEFFNWEALYKCKQPVWFFIDPYHLKVALLAFAGEISQTQWAAIYDYFELLYILPAAKQTAELLEMEAFHERVLQIALALQVDNCLNLKETDLQAWTEWLQNKLKLFLERPAFQEGLGPQRKQFCVAFYLQLLLPAILKYLFLQSGSSLLERKMGALWERAVFKTPEFPTQLPPFLAKLPSSSLSQSTQIAVYALTSRLYTTANVVGLFFSSLPQIEKAMHLWQQYQRQLMRSSKLSARLLLPLERRYQLVPALPPSALERRLVPYLPLSFFLRNFKAKKPDLEEL